MDDRKLLQLAAKAAGIEHPAGEHCINGPALWDCKKLSWWRPLTDDSDAFRLAVALKFIVDVRTIVISVEQAGEETTVCVEQCNNDDYSRAKATRRAIVRAAAEIGKSIP